jgi:NAD(P)-dependent dehydrogenase (short-subunit alcohol dehydrogenase family)
MSSALVLGANGGVGREVVAQLTAAGCAQVVTADRTGDVDHRVDVADSTEGSGYSRWLAGLDRGAPVPDLLVWSVGVYPRVPPHAYGAGELRAVLDSNLTGFLMFVGALTRAQRRDQRQRRLVVVGSQAAATGGTDAVYAASKAGLTAAMKSLAREYSSLRLIANCVSPGPTDTPMAAVMGDRRAHYEKTIPLGRFNRAAEVAQVVVWLLTQAPEAVLGAVIDIDGGLVRR